MCAVQSHGLHFNWPPLQYLGPFAFSNKFYKLGGRQNGLEKDTPPHLLLHDQVGLGAWLASRSGSGAAWLESWSLARRSGSGSAWLAVISLFLRDLLGPYLALIAPHLLPASEITHDNARASDTRPRILCLTSFWIMNSMQGPPTRHY